MGDRPFRFRPADPLASAVAPAGPQRKRHISGPSGLLAAVLALPLVLSACVTPASPPAAASPSGEAITGGYGDFLVGSVATARRDLPLATASLSRALAQAGDADRPSIRLRLLIALLMEGRADAAAPLARQALQDTPGPATDPGLFALVLTEQAIRAEDWAKAESLLATIPRQGLMAVIVPLLQAWTAQGQGKPALAQSRLDLLDQGADQLDRSGPLPLFRDTMIQIRLQHSALIYDQAGQTAEAQDAYDRLLRLPTGRTLRTLQLATSFYQRHGLSVRLMTLLDTLRKNPDQGPVPRTIASRNPVPDAVAGSAEALFLLARMTRQLKNDDLSLVMLRLALDLAPDHPLGATALADAMIDVGQNQAALQALATLPPDNDLYPAEQLRMATLLELEQRPDDAAALLDKLARKIPELIPDILYRKAELYRRAKNWPQAIATYDSLLPLTKSPQGQAELLFYRAISYEQSKRWPQAEADFRESLRLMPDQAEVLNYLGYSWVDQGQNLAEARTLLEKALALKPDDGAIVDSYGWALYRLGEPQKALQALERAAQLVPSDPTVSDHLGDALWSSGDKIRAHYHWSRALFNKPEPDLKAKLDEKLARPLPPATYTGLRGPVPVSLPAAPPGWGMKKTPAPADTKKPAHLRDDMPQ